MHVLGLWTTCVARNRRKVVPNDNAVGLTTKYLVMYLLTVGFVRGDSLTSA
jgi:hypothetical protein